MKTLNGIEQGCLQSALNPVCLQIQVKGTPLPVPLPIRWGEGVSRSDGERVSPDPMGRGCDGDRNVRAPRLVLGPEINDENVVEHGANELNEGLMLGVGDVGVAVLLAFEGEDEA